MVIWRAVKWLAPYVEYTFSYILFSHSLSTKDKTLSFTSRLNESSELEELSRREILLKSMFWPTMEVLSGSRKSVVFDWRIEPEFDPPLRMEKTPLDEPPFSRLRDVFAVTGLPLDHTIDSLPLSADTDERSNDDTFLEAILLCYLLVFTDQSQV
mmetsp:Transcript_23350/g.41311  ORF Transcript_23350/g.41311 Transcript_23350/m.41311 type:complete len:155 (+) Transcript_23350:901-1365(+)